MAVTLSIFPLSLQYLRDLASNHCEFLSCRKCKVQHNQSIYVYAFHHFINLSENVVSALQT